MILTLIEKEHLLDNVWAFRFEPSEPLEWMAGQYVSVELPHKDPDGEGTRRWFTISSAPYEKILQITTRVTQSTFKQALSQLNVGDTALQLLDKPHGDFVWEDSDKPLVFVAGGIGITPFHSMLKQRAHENLPLHVTLIYASRTPEVPFKDELQAWIEKDPQFKVQYVVGEPLTAARLMALVPTLNQSLVYLTGPQPLVVPLADDLEAQGLPEAQLKQDFFPAYTKHNY
ncbi:MAG TPA: FAD-dependent oxidoreductase [Candidatus Saccharimonadales bacterium]|nr:FAD-dependent oxidoreductase [Candidatus Saccharimonadales bacterium]